MHYVIVVRVPTFRIDEQTVAMESAFKEHLLMLWGMLKENFDKLTVIVPEMSRSDFEKSSTSLAQLNQSEEEIEIRLARGLDAGKIKYNLFRLIPNFLIIHSVCRRADVVHAGRDFPTSLFNFLGTASAAIHRKPCIFTVDIDNRPTGRMLYMSGLWSKRTYLLDKFLYTPLVNLQIRFAARYASLLLVKGDALARDFDTGRAAIKKIHDVVHDESMILGEQAMASKLELHRDLSRPLRTLFFGRLVGYKGIDHSIRAVKICRDRGELIDLTIIGDGPEKEKLARLVDELGLQNVVHLVGAMPYQSLITSLHEYDILLATPLGSDTPRNIFDAMSQGLATVAYDTPYYLGLVYSGAVFVSEWNDPEGIAANLQKLSADRSLLADASRDGLEFARTNTQEYWLKKRVEWTRQHCLKLELNFHPTSHSSAP